ncbi:hypothetical protein C0J52_14573 [Blattella germanica]|nr:hypothetical protein C0J52_14573 [Blattella germanica]
MSWSREALCALIDNYKKHTCLYVVRSPLYHNKHARQKALETIAEDLAPWRPTTPEEVKLKFNNLRTAFLTEKKLAEKTHQISGSEESKYVPNLWYYDRIKYIGEHIIPRRSRTAPYELYGMFGPQSSTNAVTYNPCTNLPNHGMVDPDDLESSGMIVPLKKVKVELDNDDSVSVSSSEARAVPEFWTLNGTEESEVDPLQDFGNFVVSRLRRIRDTDILLKLEHDIQLKIMEAELKDNLASGDS